MGKGSGWYGSLDWASRQLIDVDVFLSLSLLPLSLKSQ